MKNYRVEPINPCEVKPWLKLKHYAKRVPLISHAYGLYKNGDLIGVCTFGSPPTPNLCRGICGEEYSKIVLEFNRLCLEYNRKNEASYLVGNAIKILPQPKILVSYADTQQGHIGYIYQATNWLYTGATLAHDSEYMVGGKRLHARNLTSRGIKDPKRWAQENGIKIIQPDPKHRYVYFVGDKRFKRSALKALKYKILPYPKGETKRYDTSMRVEKQCVLF